MQLIQIARTVQCFGFETVEKRHAGSWLSRLPLTKMKLVQVHGGDQSPLPPLWNSFVGTGIHNGPVPPALKRRT